MESAYGADLVEVATGLEALTELRSRRFDALVTDLSHPAPDGIALLRVLRREGTLRRLPVLVQSASVTDDRELEAWRAGARAVLLKPYLVEDLISSLNEILDVTGDADEAILELATETQVLEYKRSVSFKSKADRAALAKHVIAMANTGGGTIVVGVAETSPGVFSPVGLSSAEQEALETTRVNNALRPFLDPPVAVRARRVSRGGSSFVFLEIPSAGSELVMPVRDYPEAGLFRGRIYARTTAAESAPLETAFEIRALIDRLARQRFGDANQTPPT